MSGRGGSARRPAEPTDGPEPAGPQPFTGGTPLVGQEKTGRLPPPPLSRVLGNRDWPITIDCLADAVVLRPGNQRFAVTALTPAGSGDHPLVQALRQLIAGRQAGVRPGEPPYRPMLRIHVHPDGLRAYYLAYPLLASLRLPMTRENVEVEARTAGAAGPAR